MRAAAGCARCCVRLVAALGRCAGRARRCRPEPGRGRHRASHPVCGERAAWCSSRRPRSLGGGGHRWRPARRGAALFVETAAGVSLHKPLAPIVVGLIVVYSVAQYEPLQRASAGLAAALAGIFASIQLAVANGESYGGTDRAFVAFLLIAPVARRPGAARTHARSRGACRTRRDGSSIERRGCGRGGAGADRPRATRRDRALAQRHDRPGGRWRSRSRSARPSGRSSRCGRSRRPAGRRSRRWAGCSGCFATAARSSVSRRSRASAISRRSSSRRGRRACPSSCRSRARGGRCRRASISPPTGSCRRR